MYRRRATVLLLACLAVACRGAGRRELLDLGSYSLRDLKPFQDVLIEDELASHPHLHEATVYHLDFSIGDSRTSLDASARILFSNRQRLPIEEIPFFLYPNLTPGGLEIVAVSIGGLPATSELREKNSRLVVRLPRPLEPGQKVEVDIDYTLSVPVTETGNYAGFGCSAGVLSLAYAYPMIRACEGWDHLLPVPYGDFTYNEASFYLVRITMPPGLILAAPGAELARQEDEGGSEVLFALGPARDLYLAASEDFELRSEWIGKTVLRSFSTPEATAASDRVLSCAAAALRSYGKRFGPYPYTTLTIVSVPFSAYGLEFSGIIINARRLYELSRSYNGISASVLLESTTAHEVAHQWFYASVGNDQITEPWLDEALAQYSTWLYYQDRYGEAAARSFFQSFTDRWERVGRKEIPIGGAMDAYTPKEYGAIVYGRGPLFIKALSDRMGQEAFDRFLREYCRVFEWDLVDSEEFEAAAEAACGCRLDDLFARWVTGLSR